MKKLLIGGLVGKSGVLVLKDGVVAKELFAGWRRNTEIFGQALLF
jgi:hypothetical protein